MEAANVKTTNKINIYQISSLLDETLDDSLSWIRPSYGHPVEAFAGVLELRGCAGQPTGSAGSASSCLSKLIKLMQMRMHPDSPRCLNMSPPALYTCSSTCLYM